MAHLASHVTLFIIRQVARIAQPDLSDFVWKDYTLIKKLAIKTVASQPRLSSYGLLSVRSFKSLAQYFVFLKFGADQHTLAQSIRDGGL